MKQKGIIIFSAIIIAMFCVLGLYARPMPYDEYAQYNAVANQGFIQAQISWYVRWTGRVLNSFLVSLCTSFRLEKIQPFMPFINIITYILAVFSLIGTLIPSMKSGAKFSLSFLVCALTLCFLFSLKETFYWIPGMPYFWSTTLIVFALSLAVKAFRGSTSSFWLCMILLFLNGTMLEQPCVYQGVAAFLGMLFFLRRGNRRCAMMSGAFWLASIAGFCVVYFAPGTAIRMKALNAVEVSLIKKIMRGFFPAFRYGIADAEKFFVKPLVYSVIFFLPAIADRIHTADEKLSRRLKVWHIVAVMFAISMFMQYMMGVICGGGLPQRGISLSLWLMYFTWILLWIFFYRGKLIQSDGFRNVCVKLRWPVLILSIVISTNFTECLTAFRTAPQFAAEWEARVELMRSQVEQGVENLQVPPIKVRPALIFSDIDNRADWAGPSVAHYYGAKNVFLVPEYLSGDTEAVKKIISGDIEVYSKLAENGDTDAMMLMGDYWNPKVQQWGKAEAEKDIDKALKWYTMGVEAGDVQCMKPMSGLLLRKRNFVSAVYWRMKYIILTTRL